MKRLSLLSILCLSLISISCSKEYVQHPASKTGPSSTNQSTFLSNDKKTSASLGFQFLGSKTLEKYLGTYQVEKCSYETNETPDYFMYVNLERELNDLEDKTMELTVNEFAERMFGFWSMDSVPMKASFHFDQIKEYKDEQTEGLFWNENLKQYGRLDIDRKNFGFSKKTIRETLKFNPDTSITIINQTSLNRKYIIIRCHLKQI
jgi:hypothetical protein